MTTFDIDPSKKYSQCSRFTGVDLKSFLSQQSVVTQNKGKILLTEQDPQKPGHILAYPRFSNGFVSACFNAYNHHMHLTLSPDQVWVMITTSLSRYIDANAERLRSNFVNHAGKIELVAYGGGNIFSADYSSLVTQLTNQIDKYTKDDVASWVQCDFSTTTEHTKLISKFVLMGAMKNYFSYKMCLECGLPKVTLTGTLDDWKSIRTKVDKLSTWKDSTLTEWSSVLGPILDEFVNAVQGKVDKDFWNRISTIDGGGSGPSYLQGWILGFIGFNEKGQYILNSAETIKTTRSFGKLDTDDIPACAVQVPVKIDDNGVLYDTLFYAGSLMNSVNEETASIEPTLDWALIDITK